MFGNKKDSKNRKNTMIDSLVGQNTVVTGDIKFSGGLHVDGTIKGNVVADKEDKSTLSISEMGVVEGEVHVSNILLNGTVIGNVYAYERVELAPNAKVTGNVYYNLIEMAMGSEVNGNLVHQLDSVSPPQGTGEQSDSSNDASSV